TVSLLPEETKVIASPREDYTIAEDQDILVGVDTVISEELKKEGLARDIVRRVQNQRKDAGFDIADHIETYFETGEELAEVFTTYGDYIAAETLSEFIRKAKPPAGAHVTDYEINGESLKLGLVRRQQAHSH
ncbi:MAG: isoleucine--tRNA ligase, partial [Candidatus Bathyarchaeota archaeon]